MFSSSVGTLEVEFCSNVLAFSESPCTTLLSLLLFFSLASSLPLSLRFLPSETASNSVKLDSDANDAEEDENKEEDEDEVDKDVIDSSSSFSSSASFSDSM